QADANARQISDAGGDVKVVWFPGGHGSAEPSEHVNTTISDWLVGHLTGSEETESQRFDYGIPGPVNERNDDTDNTRWVTADGYPGIEHADPTRHQRIRLHGSQQRVIRPAGATPSAVSGLPLLQQFISDSPRLANRISIDPPDQSAGFTTGPLENEQLVTGSSRVTLRIKRTDEGPSDGDDVLFAKLYDVDDEGNTTLPATAVSAFRVPDTTEEDPPAEVTVTLPGIVHAFEQNHALRLVVGTTDQAYTVPNRPAQYEISLADGTLSVPVVTGETTEQQPPVGQLLGIAGVLLAGVAIATISRI